MRHGTRRLVHGRFRTIRSRFSSRRCSKSSSGSPLSRGSGRRVLQPTDHSRFVTLASTQNTHTLEHETFGSILGAKNLAKNVTNTLLNSARKHQGGSVRDKRVNTTAQVNTSKPLYVSTMAVTPSAAKPISPIDIGKISEVTTSSDPPSPRSFYQKYTLSSEIGCGSSGVVHRAQRKKDNKWRAVKIVETNVFDSREIEMPIIVHSSGRARNVFEIEDVFETGDKTHIVQGYYRGGDLLDFLLDHGHFNEREAGSIVQQVLQSIRSCHEMRVAHLDIKPENFVLRNPLASRRALGDFFSARDDKDQEIVLIDFGCSRELPAGVDEESVTSTYVGTTGYVAPEILLSRAGFASDMWSVGVIAYMLLTGRTPFKTGQGGISEILGARFSTDGKWNELSDSAKDFVRGLLVKEPSGRMDVSEALEHPFVSTTTSASNKRDTAKSMVA